MSEDVQSTRLMANANRHGGPGVLSYEQKRYFRRTNRSRYQVSKSVSRSDTKLLLGENRFVAIHIRQVVPRLPPFSLSTCGNKRLRNNRSIPVSLCSSLSLLLRPLLPSPAFSSSISSLYFIRSVFHWMHRKRNETLGLCIRCSFSERIVSCFQPG